MQKNRREFLKKAGLVGAVAAKAGGATGAQMRELARTIRDGVREAYGVILEAEPTIVGGLD